MQLCKIDAFGCMLRCSHLVTHRYSLQRQSQAHKERTRIYWQLGWVGAFAPVEVEPGWSWRSHTPIQPTKRHNASHTGQAGAPSLTPQVFSTSRAAARRFPMFGFSTWSFNLMLDRSVRFQFTSNYREPLPCTLNHQLLFQRSRSPNVCTAHALLLCCFGQLVNALVAPKAQY